MDGRYLFIPVISALIGWFTNFLVLKFLFWPRNPYTIPLTNIKIQGVFSKRKADIARAISQVVSEDLMSKDKLIDSIDKEKAVVDLLEFTEIKVEDIVDKRLSLILPGSIKKKISKVVKNVIHKDLDYSVREGIEKLLSEGKEQLDIAIIIENEIISLDVKEVERLTFKVAKKEFKFIEIFGGVLGFIIGAFQLIVLGLLWS